MERTEQRGPHPRGLSLSRGRQTYKRPPAPHGYIKREEKKGSNKKGAAGKNKPGGSPVKHVSRRVCAPGMECRDVGWGMEGMGMGGG